MVIVDGRAATSTFAFITGIAELIKKHIGIKTVPEAGPGLILEGSSPAIVLAIASAASAWLPYPLQYRAIF